MTTSAQEMTTWQPGSDATKTAFGELVAPDAKLELVVDGFRFTEGPVWVPSLEDGQPGFLLFSDIPNSKIHKFTEGIGITTYRRDSNHTNGNFYDANTATLYSAEQGKRAVTRTGIKTGDHEVVISEFEGKKFNSPNDLVVKSDGSVWFTDPTYGLAKRPKEMDGQDVYRWDPTTKAVTRVAGEAFHQPNGLAFSPDEERLYIADSGKHQRIMVYAVAGNRLAEGEVFAENVHPDGMRVDAGGNLWVGAKDGVRVYAPDGSLLGTIATEKQVTNLTFGGEDRRTLFITSRDQVLRIPVRVDPAPTGQRE
ncbi:MAG: SMP-30/gluconolactonase/LRE family protein [Verrucomicrobiota bacterium]